MGQTWVIANLDRREFIDPHHLGDGGKLWEFAFRAHGPTNVAIALLLAKRPTLPDGEVVGVRAGSWCGNRITIVGDYDEEEYEKIAGMVGYANISVEVVEMVRRYLAAFNPPIAP